MTVNRHDSFFSFFRVYVCGVFCWVFFVCVFVCVCVCGGDCDCGGSDSFGFSSDLARMFNDEQVGSPPTAIQVSEVLYFCCTSVVFLYICTYCIFFYLFFLFGMHLLSIYVYFCKKAKNSYDYTLGLIRPRLI